MLLLITDWHSWFMRWPKGGRWTRRESRSLGRVSSHLIIINDLISIICGMVFDIIRTKLLDMKIMPMKEDAQYLTPNLTLILWRLRYHC